MNEHCCVNCTWCKIYEDDDYICTNSNSYYYGDMLEYNHSCEDWEE